MGACASRPTPGGDAGPAGVSQRYMLPFAESGKRSTADVIASALLAQEEADPTRRDSTKAFAAHLASRLGIEDRRDSALAAFKSAKPVPAAESGLSLGDHLPGAKASKDITLRNLALDSQQDSFEFSRAETVKRLAILQKSFKGSVSPAWAFAPRKPVNDVDDADDPYAAGGRASDSYHDVRGSNQSAGSRPSGGKGSGRCSGSGRAGEGKGRLAHDSVRNSLAEEEVMPLGYCIGGAVHGTTVAGVAEAEAAGILGQMDGVMASTPAAAGGGGGREGSRRTERCASNTPRREDDSSSCFRTISVSRMQLTTKASGGEAGGGGGAAAATAANAGAAGDGGGTTDGITEVRSETDELTSLPLPNLISGPPDGGKGGAGGGQRVVAPAVGHRYSAASYLQQGPPQPSASAGGGTRNSDLGYYLEEARFSCSSPSQGARPVRHNLMESPMGRQRAALAAKEGEEAGRPVPVVLDYVPSIKSQPTRSNVLLVQSSQKQRMTGCGSSVGPLGPLDDDEGGDIILGSLGSRRLDYVPNKSFSRKFSHATFQSGSLLLAAGSNSRPTSRPMSPSTSRHSLSSPKVSDNFLSSLRNAPGNGGAGDNDRCFHVTRGGASAAAASAAATTTRLRDDGERRSSSSASQIHFGASSSSLQQQQQQVLQSSSSVPPPPPPVAALGSTTFSRESSRRAQRITVTPTLESRPSVQQLSSPIPSRLHIQSSGTISASKRTAVHEVLGSAAWTGPGTATAAPLSASGGSPRAVFSTEASRTDGGEDAVIASGGGGGGVYSVGSGGRTVGRAARLLATLQRMGTPATGVTPAVAQ